MRKRLLRLMLGLTIGLCLVGGFFVWQTGTVEMGKSVCLSPAKTSPICYRLRVLSMQPTTAIATDPNSAVLASGFHERIQVWDLQTGKLLRSLYGHQG
ncbi:MAG TPA: hypothetical protein V6C64_00425, partial [Microcoleaceae cyanobacterium]